MSRWKALALIWIGTLAMAETAGAVDPVVSNVRSAPRGDSGFVDITYDLSDADSDTVHVTVEVSTDGGESYITPATGLTGDAGASVAPGAGRSVEWNAGATMPVERLNNLQVRVTADDAIIPPPPPGMVLIPAGTNSGVDPDFGPYSLTVEPFYMDIYEVTKDLWKDVKNWQEGNGYDLAAVGGGKTSDHPVHSVSWYDCVKWCNARSEMEGRRPVYYTDAELTQVYKTGQVVEPYVDAAAGGYRLPTDVEWEYAARGGVANRRFPWGWDIIQHARANYSSDSTYGYDTSPTRGYHPDWDDGAYPYTSLAGSFDGGKNGYGLHDMAGNVWEWCYDWHPNYEGLRRVTRGGGWSSHAIYQRVGLRFYFFPVYRADYLGFRTIVPLGPK